MHHLTTTFALLDFNFRQFLTLAIPVTAILVGGTIAVCGMYFHNRRREMWHATARLALEKGQPLPPEMEDEPRAGHSPREAKAHGNDLRSGFILIAIGLGLFLFFSGVGSGAVAYVAAIPGFIGVALVLFALLSGNRGRGKNPDQYPPQT